MVFFYFFFFFGSFVCKWNCTYIFSIASEWTVLNKRKKRSRKGIIKYMMLWDYAFGRTIPTHGAARRRWEITHTHNCTQILYLFLRATKAQQRTARKAFNRCTKEYLLNRILAFKVATKFNCRFHLILCALRMKPFPFLINCFFFRSTTERSEF